MNFGKLLARFKTYRVSDLEGSYPTIPHASEILRLREKVSFLVIDDEIFPPMENLVAQGFKLVSVNNINNLNTVDGYDVVVSDIRGIGQEFSDLEGGGVISEIRRLYPDKYIIVYSGSFKMDKAVHAALNNSNKKILKSAPPMEWSAVLDEAIGWVSNPTPRWRAIRNQLEDRGAAAADIERAEDAFVRAIIHKDKSIFEKFSQRSEISQDIRSIARSLLTSAIWATIT